MGTAPKSARPSLRVRAVKGDRRQHRSPTTPELETKTLPSQARSRSTFDQILRVAAEVLASEGTEAFSVNAVCKQAALTPPAFYRYFPNKFALLKALAERLMEAGDEAVLSAMAHHPIARSEDELVAELRDVLTALVKVTASFPGSVSILRAMRATPVMRDAQRVSTGRIAERRFERLRTMFPEVDARRLRRGAWLGLETANVTMELVIERAGDEVGASAEAIIDDAAILLARYYWQLGTQRAQEHKKRKTAPRPR